MTGRVSSSECKHQRTRSTLLWPPEANTVTCEDCGEVQGRVSSRDEVLREVATELERMAVMSSSAQRKQGWLDAARLVEGMVSDA